MRAELWKSRFFIQPEATSWSPAHFLTLSHTFPHFPSLSHTFCNLLEPSLTFSNLLILSHTFSDFLTRSHTLSHFPTLYHTFSHFLCSPFPSAHTRPSLSTRFSTILHFCFFIFVQTVLGDFNLQKLPLRRL